MSDWSQSAMFDDPHARRSDPTSSHVAVATIAKWSSLNDAILTAARNCGEIPFDDTDLTVMVTQLKGEPVQRNVVARARGLLERDGHLVRLGLKQRDDRRTLHFQYNDGHRVGIVVEPRPKLVEIEGIAWCTQHRAIWKEGEPWCQDYLVKARYWPPDECDEVSLYTTGEPNG